MLQWQLNGAEPASNKQALLGGLAAVAMRWTVEIAAPGGEEAWALPGQCASEENGRSKACYGTTPVGALITEPGHRVLTLTGGDCLMLNFQMRR